MDNGSAVVVTRASTDISLQSVEHALQTGVPIQVNVDLVSRIPVDPKGSLEYVQLGHPFALMVIKIRLTNLH